MSKTVRLAAIEQAELAAANGGEADDEPGRVERDPDVMSDVPEIDTTRAEPPPKRNRFVLIVAALLTILGVVVVVVVVAGAAFFAGHCTTSTITERVESFNLTTMFTGFDVIGSTAKLYRSCGGETL
mgnify:CR=1 FL=1